MPESRNLAFVGLGVMGYPMAGHLVKAGHAVMVWNRTAARAEKWTGQHKGKAAASPRAAAAGADLVFLCVGNDDDVRSVVHGDNGVLAGMRKGAVLVDHTTASDTLARELAGACAAKGVAFLDAPVSGGQAGAKNGALTVMCGGDEATFAAARPVIDAYARACVLIGPTGSGQLAKMMNQICIAGVLQGLSEAINLGQKAGLDIEKVIGAISKGAAGSWQMDNRWKTMIAGQFEFGFAVNWMRKDLAMCLDVGEKTGARLPLTALVDQFYKHVQARGGGRWDTSALVQLLQRD
ncbi:MAG: NAD(P)-dependent oxidoreductase [Alphaproteobacteria bacterium]|nr:NAD(P)-dependent oxidoreductase [Alphaproteobacteria bacterium]